MENESNDTVIISFDIFAKKSKESCKAFNITKLLTLQNY